MSWVGGHVPTRGYAIVGGPRNTWFLGPIPVHIPNGISTGTAILVQLMVTSNRQTDTHSTDHGTLG